MSGRMLRALTDSGTLAQLHSNAPRFVLYHLCVRANAFGYVRKVSHRQIARDLCLPSRTVDRAMAELTAAGLLTRGADAGERKLTALWISLASADTVTADEPVDNDASADTVTAALPTPRRQHPLEEKEGLAVASSTAQRTRALCRHGRPTTAPCPYCPGGHLAALEPTGSEHP